MKKGEIYSGLVTDLAFPNKANVHITEPEEGDIQVKNLLPGQKVSVRLTKKRKGKCEGRLVELLERSADELETAGCPHADICGGCVYQTLPYEKELELKQSQVLRLLAPVLPEAETLFEGIHPSPRKDGYRNKMEYTFGDEYRDGPLALGLHKRGAFYDIVPVTGCRIADGDFAAILSATRDYFSELGVPYYHRMRHEGYLRHLLVRKAARTGEILTDLITASPAGLSGRDGAEQGKETAEAADGTPGGARQPMNGSEQPENGAKGTDGGCGLSEEELLEGWKERLLSLNLEGTWQGILHTRNDSLADAVRDEGTQVLYGTDAFTEQCLGLQFRITPFSFFQTNSLGAEVLYDTARSMIRGALGDGGKTVFDLYSGTGTIAQMLAPVAGSVIGVEIVEEAVEAARENAALNHLTNCRFLAEDVLKALDQIEEKPDVIVLDPPREGVHPKALKKIIAYGAESILYISCKPTSLARDLVELQAGGYAVKRLCCVDMFPGTANVETVVLLSNTLKKKPYVTLDVDMDDYYRIKAESEKTEKNAGKSAS